MSVNGTVKFFSEEKGYGFIVPDDGSGDVFIHKTVLKSGPIKTLVPNQRVVFDIAASARGNGRGGRAAASVRLL